MFGATTTRVIVVTSAILMRLLLDYLYYNYVMVNYAYAGFEDNPNFWYNAASWFITVVLAIVVPLEGTASKTVTLLFFFLFVLPMGPVSALGGMPINFYLLVILFYIVLLMVIYLPPSRPLKMADIAFGREIFVFTALAALATTVVLFVTEGGLSLISLDVFNVYDVRWDINNILTGPLGYLAEWCKYVFAPGLLMFSIWRRSWQALIGSLAIFVLLFAITSAKAMLFYPVLIGAVYLGVRMRLMAPIIALLSLGATALAWAAYAIAGQNLLSNQILVRVIFIPARDAYRYYEYFLTNDKMYFTNTILAAPFRTVEEDNIALLLGQNTWGYGSEVYMNTGVFATAYMHLGWYGMILFPIAVGFSLRLLDKLILGRIPQEIAVPIVIISAVQFLQSDFFTTLLSHGMLLLYVFLLLIGRRQLVPARGRAGDTSLLLQSHV